MCQNVSKKVLLTAGPLFQIKIQSRFRVFVKGERQKYTNTLRTKDWWTLGIKWARGNLILGVNRGYGFIFGSLWHFITKFDRYYKMRQLFYGKMWQKFITKFASFFITKYDCYITKCDVSCIYETIFSCKAIKSSKQFGNQYKTSRHSFRWVN